MIRARNRKPGKRYPCGKRIRQETEREAMATALDARRRHYGVSGERARDERLGTSLGRLAFRGKISDRQCQAGLAFADLYRRHHMAMGLPLPSPSSVASILINEGIFGSSPSEPMLDALERLRSRFEEATDALDQCDREHALAAGRRPTLLVFRAVCADEDATCWPHEDLGNLRVALNALVRVLRL
jgi:hypothetical protein